MARKVGWEKIFNFASQEKLRARRHWISGAILPRAKLARSSYIRILYKLYCSNSKINQYAHTHAHKYIIYIYNITVGRSRGQKRPWLFYLLFFCCCCFWYMASDHCWGAKVWYYCRNNYSNRRYIRKHDATRFVRETTDVSYIIFIFVYDIILQAHMHIII